MGRVQRSRWQANVKSMEIVNKDRKDITPEDIEFLKENYTSQGGLLPKGFNGGAFFTPTHVARFMVDALQIPKGSRILEPSCGSGVFFEHIPDGCEITGLELDTTSAKVASLIYPDAEVIAGNAFEHRRRDYFDFIIGNPPFGETIEVEGETDLQTLRYTKKTNTSKGKSEFAFVELAIKAAKPGGYIAFILPVGLSYNNQGDKIRQVIRDNCWIIANIKLANETFAHVGTTVPTQILIVRKVTPNAERIKSQSTTQPIDAEFYEGQQPVFMAHVQDIGWGKKGSSTDKWGDGLTQLDELIDVFTDDYLCRENLYPYTPSWVMQGKDETFAPFWNEDCEGHKQARAGFRKEEQDTALLMWNEMTLGMGEGRSWDFSWQDEIVAEYYEKKNRLAH